MRILLVEDEKKIASFISRTLRENAYVVDIADTGEKALELGSDITYDAILLDVRLPGISGIEVCRELRQRGVEAPVMMLTARTLVEHRVEGLDAGADDYLTKPFVLAEFLARVRALVRRGFHKGNARLRYADLELDRHHRRAGRYLGGAAIHGLQPVLWRRRNRRLMPTGKRKRTLYRRFLVSLGARRRIPTRPSLRRRRETPHDQLSCGSSI